MSLSLKMQRDSDTSSHNWQSCVAHPVLTLQQTQDSGLQAQGCEQNNIEGLPMKAHST